MGLWPGKRDNPRKLASFTSAGLVSVRSVQVSSYHVGLVVAERIDLE